MPAAALLAEPAVFQIQSAAGLAAYGAPPVRVPHGEIP